MLLLEHLGTAGVWDKHAVTQGGLSVLRCLERPLSVPPGCSKPHTRGMMGSSVPYSSEMENWRESALRLVFLEPGR